MRKNKKDLSLEERQTVYKLHEARYGIREIARIVARSPSTISRELRRGRKHGAWVYMRWYERVKLAHDAAKARRGRPRNRLRILKEPAVQKYVQEGLSNKKSPMSISLEIGKDLPGKSISHETIYQFIYKVEKGWRKYLLRYNKRKRCRRGKEQTLVKLCVQKRRVSERAKEANKRLELGHLESDFVVSARGGRSCLLVVVDRASRRVYLRKTPNREANTAQAVLYAILRPLPRINRRTMTLDNDSAHNALPRLEKVFAKDCFKVFFCDAYCAWQRGTVEAVIGILRRWFPKKTNFDEVSHDYINFVEHWFNSRAMRCLGGKTPFEAEQELLKTA